MFPESGELGAGNREDTEKGHWLHDALMLGRGKSARVINYEEFKKALEELATKRFKGKSKEEAFDAICQLVAGKEPANLGVTVSAPLVSVATEGNVGNLGWGWERARLPHRCPWETVQTESKNRGCCGPAD
jgi:hypothetical protein